MELTKKCQQDSFISSVVNLTDECESDKEVEKINLVTTEVITSNKNYATNLLATSSSISKDDGDNDELPDLVCQDKDMTESKYKIYKLRLVLFSGVIFVLCFQNLLSFDVYKASLIHFQVSYV